ncbi:hypothetical protein AB0J81_12455 [Streptomyces bobili]|uniref:hypothetical protein n=1 Tax=Streptomyces bobili TaxID=67280 RepID=UPI0034397AB4
MPHEHERMGVCVVRVVCQPYGPLITVQVDLDPGKALTVRKTTTVDAEIAVEFVREFILDFIAASPPAG